MLSLIEQRKLPTEEVWISCRTEQEVAAAIRDMVVRGAPAIGITAAFGVALCANRLQKVAAPRDVRKKELEKAIDLLSATRPTAVNLFWALEEMRTVLDEPASVIEAKAMHIWHDDVARCLAIGKHGATLIPQNAVILTHCNTGALATGGYGTALGVIRAAHEAGKNIKVLADETRPYWQGSRLTAWELARDGIDVTVIPDSAAAWLMKQGKVSCAIVGADRITANGDVVNKIGTYSVALGARANGVPFYVAAPCSTIDLTMKNGSEVVIEERAAREVTHVGERQIAADVPVQNPAFDVTPAELVTKIVTEKGLFDPSELCSVSV